MTIIKTTDVAHHDLLDMLTWITQENPKTALSFIKELEQKASKILSVVPQSGRPLGDGTRYIVVRGRVVIYKYHAGTDEVIVLHYYGPGQDWR